MSIRAYNNPVAPTPETVLFAEQAMRSLDQPNARLTLHDAATGVDVPLTAQTLTLLRQLMSDLAQKKAVAILPLDQELTPNQVADMLNVSRSTVMRLIADGELAAHQVGSHHRVRLQDLLVYKTGADMAHERGMRELAALEQELGLE
jgi:excisionase family DNA binding protein